MDKCVAAKRNGELCTLSARVSSDYCWAHDPVNAEARKKVAAAGGKARHAKHRGVHEELIALAEQQKELAELIREGDIISKVGQVVSNVLNNAAVAYRASISAREQEELVDQVNQIQEMFKAQRGEGPDDRRPPWGA
jgi:hypothetical protein